MEAPEIPAIGQVAAALFDDCDKCGKRPKCVDQGKARDWCARCVAIYRRRNPSIGKVTELMTEQVGVGYLSADVTHIDPFYMNQILKAPGDIYLWGGVGVGKTYAMAALFKHLLFAGHECKRINFDDFCCRVRSTMGKKSKVTEYEIVNEMVHCDNLFIDDIGLRTKQETDFAYVTLYTILNKRQENNLPTYITTNKPIDKLAETFDARIASRLKTATIIEMKGTDRRLTK